MIGIQKNKPEAQQRLDVLVYEVKMLNACYRKIHLPVKDNINLIIRLEAFLIHARNIFSFLTPGRRDTDIHLSDFSDQNEIPIQPIILNIDEEFWERISRHCHHMTKHRLDTQIGWPISSITRELNKGVLEFVNQLPQEFTDRVSEILYCIEQTDTMNLMGLEYYKKSQNQN